MKNKRQHIIDTGKTWLQMNTVDDLKVESIAKLAGISKTTFYKHFSNKFDLIEIILKQEFDLYLNEVLMIMDSSYPFEQKIRSMLVIRQEGFKTIGSIIISVHSSINPRFESLKRMLTENTDFEDKYRQFLIREQQNGHINPDISVDAILYIDRKLNECFYETDFIKMFPDQVERMNVLTQYWLNGISSRG